MAGRAKSLVVVVACAVLFSACGAFDDEDPVPTIIPAVAPNQDIESGCWTAAERSNEISTTEGEVSMQWSSAPEMTIDPEKSYTATMETNKGTFTIALRPEEAPVTVNNFVCLARAGFYDETPFHRIVEGFVIQGGDPTGTGSGGPGYRFEDEPISSDYEEGTVAMANAGPNTNGSQFFVVLSDLRGKLGKNYTIFGKVTEGMDVVSDIGTTPVTTGRSGERSSPTEPVTLQKVTITES